MSHVCLIVMSLFITLGSATSSPYDLMVIICLTLCSVIRIPIAILVFLFRQ